MVNLTVPVDGRSSFLGILKERFPKEYQKVLRRVSSYAYRIAKTIIPQDSGRLLASLRVIPTATGVELSVSTRYADFADKGTLPHMIVPQDPKGYLKFKDQSGNTIFRKRVIHPGYPATNYMNELATKVGDFLSDEIDSMILSLNIGGAL